MHAFWADSKQLNFYITMDYSPWSEREIWPFLKANNYLQKPERPCLPKLVCMLWDHVYLHEFLSQFLDFYSIFWPPCMDYIAQGSKAKFGQCWKLTLSPKPERPRPPKLDCMHLTSPSTLAWADSFFDPHACDGFFYREEKEVQEIKNSLQFCGPYSLKNKLTYSITE